MDAVKPKLCVVVSAQCRNNLDRQDLIKLVSSGEKKNWCRPDCTSLETKRGNQSHTSPNLPVNSRALIVLRPALMSAVTSLNDKFPKNITGVGEKQDSDVAEAYLLKMNILFKNSCSPKTLLALPAALHIKRFKKRGQNRVCPALK